MIRRMGIDYSVDFDCPPKRHFGEGDYAAGAADILARVKSRNRAVKIREYAVENGLDPSKTKIKIREPDAQRNQIEREVTVVELEDHARSLDSQSGICVDCPMNLLNSAYGCLGWMNYPISQSEEDWLVGRLQPFGTIGADLCVGFINQFGITGAPIERMRQAGFFQSPCGREIILKKGLFKKHSVHTDQLLQVVLLAGECLEPEYCLGVLLWFGALAVDGVIPGPLEDRATLQRLLSLKTVSDRVEHTGLTFAGKAGPRGSFAMLLTAMHIAWVHQRRLMMSS